LILDVGAQFFRFDLTDIQVGDAMATAPAVRLDMTWLRGRWP